MGITQKKYFTIDQGEDKNIDVNLVDADLDEVVDLTAATEIEARFKKSDGTVLTKTMTGAAISVLSIAGGKVRIALSEADTASLLVGEKQTFEVEAVVGGVTTIVKFERSLTVNAQVA